MFFSFISLSAVLLLYSNRSMPTSKILTIVLAVGLGYAEGQFRNEYKPMEILQDTYSSPLPYTYIDPEDLPDNFNWGDVDGHSYLTHSLNQHIPQYCGSCWAHGALSSLGDRIKVARKGLGDEINLSIQYILNCGNAGSCHGGSHSAVYEYIHQNKFIPYDTCMPYIACSPDSSDGFCPYVDTACSAMNTCRTCDHSGKCEAVETFPNATVGEYGTYSYYTGGFGAVVDKIKAEIFARGPVATGVNAEPLVDYTGGIVKDTKIWHMMVNHVVSIVGWGLEEETGDTFWIVRNSWGQYTGEGMGFFRIIAGHNALGIESEIAWATPGVFSVPSSDGKSVMNTQVYQDPSKDVSSIQRRLRA